MTLATVIRVRSASPALDGELLPRVGFVVTSIRATSQRVVRFYNERGTAEGWIKEGKYVLNWTRLSCHQFHANQVRLAR